MINRFSPANVSCSPNASVLVNGKPIDGCVYADVKNGIARVHMERDGKVLFDKWRKRLLVKTIRGAVAVVDESGQQVKARFDIRSNGRPSGWKRHSVKHR